MLCLCLVQFAQLVYVTPQCHLHQHALIFHLETVYHLSYQYNINIFFLTLLLITVQSNLKVNELKNNRFQSRLNKEAGSWCSYIRSPWQYMPSYSRTIHNLKQFWNSGIFHNFSDTPKKTNRWKPNLQTTFINFDFVISTIFIQRVAC